MLALDDLLNWLSILMPLAGVVGLALLVNRGFLRPGSLDNAPPRPAGLGLVELLAIGGIFLLSQALVMSVLNYAGLAPEQSIVPAATAPAAPEAPNSAERPEAPEGPKTPEAPATSATSPTTMAATVPATAPGTPITSPSATVEEPPATSASRSGIPAASFKSGVGAASTTPTTSSSTTPEETPGSPGTPETAGSPGSAWRTAALVMLMQVFGQLPAVLLVLWVAGRRPAGWRILGAVPRHWKPETKLAALCLVAAIPMVMDVMLFSQWIAIAWFHEKQPEYAHELLKAMGQSDAPGVTAVMILSAVLVAPLLEELLFRGLLQTALLEAMGASHRWLVIVSAALIFAGIHTGSVAVEALPGLFMLGLILGWMYESTGSLLPSVLVHAGFNLFNSLLTLHMAGHVG